MKEEKTETKTKKGISISTFAIVEIAWIFFGLHAFNKNGLNIEYVLFVLITAISVFAYIYRYGQKE